MGWGPQPLKLALRHDTSIAACLQTLLGLTDFPATALATAHLPLAQGGLGMLAATVTAQPAYWASWAGTLPVLHQQLPNFTASILHLFQHQPHALPTLQAASLAAQTLCNAGWQPPAWNDLTQPPDPLLEEPMASRGWQHRATAPIHTSCHTELMASSTPAAQAMLRSQAGEPSPAGIHNHPFQPRLHIPVRFVPGPAVEAPPPPPSLDSSSLPVPSPS